MQHIQTVFSGNKNETRSIGCGECQTSCQSACKTSCTVANQNCEQSDIFNSSPLRETTLSRVNHAAKTVSA